MRVDRVQTPPGLLAPSATWTLIRTDRGFWMVRSDPPVPFGRSDRGEWRLREHEIESSVIDISDLGSLAAADRAYFHSWTSLVDVRIGQARNTRDGSYPVARLRSPKRLKLEFVGCDVDTVRQFFSPVAHLVG